MKNIRCSLRALCVLRGSREFEPVRELLALLDSLPDGAPSRQADAAGAFAASLLPYDASLHRAITDYLRNSPNVFSEKFLKGSQDTGLEDMLHTELSLLAEACAISPGDIAREISYSGYLPFWHAQSGDLFRPYMEFLADARQHGFGIYRGHSMFLIENGEIVPVLHPDPIALKDLHGYERQRQTVMQNTALLLSGGPASNILLYGDSGTGKSSTVKAVASHYAPAGLRLIEVRKSQLHEIPQLLADLADKTLKFILFIDDLSFTEEDDNFAALKGILEGSVLSRAANVVIYATSNRRRLIRESFADRGSDDVHANETIQQQTALSDRFGITLPFMVPKKDTYLEIVAKLAEDQHIPEDVLFAGAERFALERGGRSGRVARQYVDQLHLDEAQI